MARGALHTFSLVHQSREQQMAARAASVARIKELLAIEPMTAAQLVDVLGAELQVVRATVFGYMRHMHKGERSIRPAGATRGRAELWELGTDLALPEEGEELDRKFARRCVTVPARQVGMQRHWMDVALFGPAREAA